MISNPRCQEVAVRIGEVGWSVDRYEATLTKTQSKILRYFLRYRSAPPLFHKRETIAKAVGCSIITVARSIKKFHEDGVATKRQISRYSPNVFKLHPSTKIKTSATYKDFLASLSGERQELFINHGVVPTRKGLHYQFMWPQKQNDTLRKSLFILNTPGNPGVIVKYYLQSESPAREAAQPGIGARPAGGGMVKNRKEKVDQFSLGVKRIKKELSLTDDQAVCFMAYEDCVLDRVCNLFAVSTKVKKPFEWAIKCCKTVNAKMGTKEDFGKVIQLRALFRLKDHPESSSDQVAQQADLNQGKIASVPVPVIDSHERSQMLAASLASERKVAETNKLIQAQKEAYYRGIGGSDVAAILQEIKKTHDNLEAAKKLPSFLRAEAVAIQESYLDELYENLERTTSAITIA